ncbi:MAG: O-antigen ligase family protein [Nitrospirota bacterium]|nr:O-antigen ligase family protein [Nitrospirota bacterium]
MYYLIIYKYGFIDLKSAIKLPLLIMGSYAAGYSISRKNTPAWPYGLVWIILSMVAGFVVFSFLSVYSIVSSGHNTEILSRSAPSFWTGGDSINGTLFGLFASLGLSLAPVLFLGRDQSLSKRYSILIIIIISLLVVAGVYVNTALQNRSPFIALVLSFIASVFLYFFIKKQKLRHKIKTVFLISIFLGILFYLFFYAGQDYSQYSITTRFEEQGLETGRYEAWMYMLKALPENMGGGRLVYIGGLNYVHNLWLDIAYDAGILPMIFLLIFHVMHLRSFIAVIRAKLPLLLILIIVSVTVSVFVGFMVEPVMRGSVMYFSATCFFLGLVRRLSNDIKLVQTYY